MSQGDPDKVRLFVALPLPPAIRDALAGLRPSAATSVRPVAAADLHITLHFLGTSVIASARSALAGVTLPGFTVGLGELGSFAAGDGRRILWAGVAPSPALGKLHARLGVALAAAGFRFEAKPYVPHITLARLGAEAPAEVVVAFLAQRFPAAAQSFECRDFALYASETLAEGARYRVLERFPLAAGSAPSLA